MRPRREALPGLLVVGFIAVIGVLITRGVSEVFPEEIFETTPFAGLSAEDIEIDPVTGLPIVPTTPDEDGQVVTWSVTEPNSPIDATNTWASVEPSGTVDTERPPVTLLATYPTYEAALAVAQELAAVVGDPEAEASWLRAAGVEPGDGFGWLGPEGSSTPFVQVVDRRLLVDGLEWREAYEPQPPEAAAEVGATGGPEASLVPEDPAAPPEPEEPASYAAPLALALERSASSVLVEGDRAGEGAVAFDLVCIGDPDQLLMLGQELADAPYAWPQRPPWLEPALTSEEQKARRTARLVAQLQGTGFIRDMLRSDGIERLSSELAQAIEAGDERAITDASVVLRARLTELVPQQLRELGRLADAIDPDQMATSLAELAGVDSDTTADAPSSLTDARDGGADYRIVPEDRRLWVTLGSWFGVAQGFAPFVAHLDANGCTDIRIVLNDYDDVRVD